MIPLTPGFLVVAVNVAAEDGVVLPIERRLSIVPMAELEREAHAEDSNFVSVGTQTDFSVSEVFFFLIFSNILLISSSFIFVG